MTRLHDREVIVSGKTGGGWRLLVQPRGVSFDCGSFAGALAKGAQLAKEFEARLVVDVPQVRGEMGPIHLIGSPRVYRVREDIGWVVTATNPPFLIQPMEFGGANAERASQRWADGLVAYIADLARTEQARRQRRKELSSHGHKIKEHGR